MRMASMRVMRQQSILVNKQVQSHVLLHRGFSAFHLEGRHGIRNCLLTMQGTESDPAASNAMSREWGCGTFDPRLEELSKELCRLSSELAQLRSDQNQSELQRR